MAAMITPLDATPSFHLEPASLGAGIANDCLWRADRYTGDRSNPSITPDLFSAQHLPDTSAKLASESKSLRERKDEPAAAASPSYALPTNLSRALRHLDNDQLDRLLAAALAERQARGGKKLPVSDEPSDKKRIKEVAPSLAQGKLNAVRAAFKAGVTPSRIARQFGISQSDVRTALAGDTPKRSV
jgi:hypothetical protein